MDIKAIQKLFFENLEPQSGLVPLFDHLPGIWFWVKDKHGRFMALNRADAQKLGGKGQEEFLGKTDAEVFPGNIGRQYMDDDQVVLKTGIPIINRIELVPNEDGTIIWNSTTKVPLYDKAGKIYGTTGFSYAIRDSADLPQPYSELVEIIDHISTHYMNPIKIQVLADMAFASVGNFNRKFKKMIGISPGEFIIKVRVKSACRELTGTRDSIAEISTKVGFSDPNYFTRQFKNHMGMSPSEYRKKNLPLNPFPA